VNPRPEASDGYPLYAADMTPAEVEEWKRETEAMPLVPRRHRRPASCGEAIYDGGPYDEAARVERSDR
jgi:hypothetical protein